ncbi:exodeoxyribonuclease X [Nocardia amikacinitolerans]|uniref:Exodeoxyribonuclease X n=1 Tax=Nocardia amikacinitolerans TaxID=756689 RepID=A0A285LT89_9NOCA|nr:3'-5' exonuclease [Nocardia amikacinitolerans]SNY88142.1 exodeoxyribonuclease X [Nocardia amikacinitolerans]
MTTPVPHALNGKALAVVDVEGNGHNPPEIIEIAILPISTDTAQVGDMRSWLIRPTAPITSIVTRKVHGITNADVAECPTWREVGAGIEAMLGGRILVAHNAKVEHKVLSAHLPSWAPPMVLDTLRLAKAVWPGLPGYGLDKLIDHAELGTTALAEQAYHRAAYDTWAAWQLLRRLVHDSGLDWDGVVRAAAPAEFAAVLEPEGGLW